LSLKQNSTGDGRVMQKITESRLYEIPVLMRTLDILEFLCGSDTPLRTNEISDATGVPRTTTYRILQTLSRRGYIAKDVKGRFSVLSMPGKSVASSRIQDGAGVHDLRIRNTDFK